MLGTLEVLDNGGCPVELRGSKLRILLAALLLRAGQPVSADHLADLLWGDNPPSGAANALQAQVSKLRRLITDVPLEGRDGGYALMIDPQEIDFERFTKLAKRRAMMTDSPPHRGPQLAAGHAHGPQQTQLPGALEDRERQVLAMPRRAMITARPSRA